MKNLSKLLLVSAITLFSFTSCVKQMDVVPTAPNTPAESFLELKASDNFDWSTTQKINFSVTGTSAQAYELPLQVMDAEGHVVYSKMQKSNENFNCIIEIPSRLEFVTVQYGEAIQHYDCTNGSVKISIN